MPSVCEVCHHVIVAGKVTNNLFLPGTFLVLALQVLSPEKPLCCRQPWETIKSMCLQAASYCQGAYSFQGDERAIDVNKSVKIKR